MRNKLSFFLTLILSVLAVFVFSVQANAQWDRHDRKNDKNKSKKVWNDNRQERTIIVRPGNQVYRSDVYYRNNRNYEGNDYVTVVQIARLNGYQDGLHEGGKDARDGDRFDPFAESDYKDGDGGYKSRYGISKDEYKQVYRQSFIRGYREAFNRYLGYSERNW